MSWQWGPDGDTAVGDLRAVPASPVVSVHAAVLKPDVADAGRIVGESVGDLVGGGGRREGEWSGELTPSVALPEGVRGPGWAEVLVLDPESGEWNLSPYSDFGQTTSFVYASISSSVKWSKILPDPLHGII